MGRSLSSWYHPISIDALGAILLRPLTGPIVGTYSNFGTAAPKGTSPSSHRGPLTAGDAPSLPAEWPVTFLFHSVYSFPSIPHFFAFARLLPKNTRIFAFILVSFRKICYTAFKSLLGKSDKKVRCIQCLETMFL